MLPTWEPPQTRGGAAARSSAPGDCGYGRRVSTETGAAFPTSGGERVKKAPAFSSLHSSFQPQNWRCTWGELWVSDISCSLRPDRKQSLGAAHMGPGAWAASSSQASGRQGPGLLSLSDARVPALCAWPTPGLLHVPACGLGRGAYLLPASVSPPVNSSTEAEGLLRGIYRMR